MKDMSQGNINIQKLIELKSKNSELDIIPMIDSEIVKDSLIPDWAGEFGESYIEEVFYSDGRVMTRRNDYGYLLDSEIERLYSLFDKDEKPEFKRILLKAKNNVNNFNWKKVIVLKIKKPEKIWKRLN